MDALGRSLARAVLDRAPDGSCTDDGGKLTAKVFLDADGKPDPKIQQVYDDKGRITLGTNDSGADGPVRRVQRALICVGLGPDLGPKQADGMYGDLTNKALKKFKTEHGLLPAHFDDVGPKTLHCLNKLAAACDVKPDPKPPDPKPPNPKPPDPKPPDPKPPNPKPPDPKPPEPPKPPKPEDLCGPGTSNPFCLPLPPVPSDTACCKPFSSENKGLAVWSQLSDQVPAAMAGSAACLEAGKVWKAYFDAKSTPFALSEAAGSCVAKSARQDTGVRGSNAAADHAEAVDRVMALIMEFLPQTLMAAKISSPFSFPDTPLATIRPTLAQAIGPSGEPGLHVDITYGNAPLNAAGQLLGGTGRNGKGSDIFGDDDRTMGGTITIDIMAMDFVTGALSGEVRWHPHVTAKDTVDFCPGNQGSSKAQILTLPLSKLEAQGLVRDVPITVDYDLDTHSRKFTNVVPRTVTPPVAPPRRVRPPGPDDHPCG
jgi:hypothetical protein